MDGGCPIRRGFFTLRGCGEPASHVCSGCGRMVCGQHVSTGAAGPQCVECAAKAQPPTDQQQADENWYDNSTTYSYRNRYYSSTRYAPYYYGGYYSTSDHTSFDQANATSPDADDSSQDLVNS